MANIITITDFDGRYLLAKDNYNTDEIDDYINRFEPIIVAKLLGADLAIAFRNNIALDGSAPTDPTFLAIYNPLQFNGSCGGLFYSEGMRSFVTGHVYFRYVMEQRLQPSITSGAVQNVNENSVLTRRDEIYERYNSSVDSGLAIQQYCKNNPDDYPTFKGSKLLYNYSL